MSSRLSRWLADPLVLLCLTAGLLAFVVQSGELGTADTMHRLQTTHWLWTSEPQVFPNDYPEFGLHGRGGQLYGWYGIGQSLLMLPADLVGTWIAHWGIFSDYEDDPQVRAIVVSYLTSILVNVLTALVGFRLLRQLRFSAGESVLGLLALMFCTTYLHYTQNMAENNYIMLLTLSGFSFQYEWLRTGSRRAVLVGSAALGLNLLTRLTTALDLVAAGVFLLLVLWFERVRGRELWHWLVAYCKVAAPVYVFFCLVDRLYQFYRFGSFTNTYVSLFAKEHRLQDPTLPANFPWSTPFYEGFLGALFKPEKSIFLFDPLLVLAILLLVVLWSRLSAEVRAYGRDFASSSAWLYQFLCEIYLLGGRFRLGRSLRFNLGGIGSAACRAVVATLSRQFERMDLARRSGVDWHQPDHPACFAGVLAAAGDLSDGDAGPSHVRDRAALQEHCRIRAGQDGCLGTQHRGHALG